MATRMEQIANYRRIQVQNDLDTQQAAEGVVAQRERDVRALIDQVLVAGNERERAEIKSVVEPQIRNWALTQTDYAISEVVSQMLLSARAISQHMK